MTDKTKQQNAETVYNGVSNYINKKRIDIMQYMFYNAIQKDEFVMLSIDQIKQTLNQTKQDMLDKFKLNEEGSRDAQKILIDNVKTHTESIKLSLSEELTVAEALLLSTLIDQFLMVLDGVKVV